MLNNLKILNQILCFMIICVFLLYCTSDKLSLNDREWVLDKFGLGREVDRQEKLSHFHKTRISTILRVNIKLIIEWCSHYIQNYLRGTATTFRNLKKEIRFNFRTKQTTDVTTYQCQANCDDGAHENDEIWTVKVEQLSEKSMQIYTGTQLDHSQNILYENCFMDDMFKKLMHDNFTDMHDQLKKLIKDHKFEDNAVVLNIEPAEKQQHNGPTQAISGVFRPTRCMFDNLFTGMFDSLMIDYG